MNAAMRRRLLSNLPYTLVVMGLAILTLAVFATLIQSRQQPRSPVDTSFQARTATDRQVDRLQERIANLPEDTEAYVQLGGAYIQKARETGDPSYYARAEEALLRALELRPDSASAMVALGAVSLGRHEFGQALSWAERSLEIDLSGPDGYGVMGDALVEMGQYDAALESYQRMVDLRPDQASYARVSYARKLMGDVEGAIEAMQMTVAAGSPGTEGAAWARVQLGDLYFSSGRIDESVKHYEAALQDFNGYHVALAALGKARAAQGRYDEAIRLYERAVAVIPQPGTLAALGDLYARTGKLDKAQLQYDTVEFIGKLAAVNQVIYNRELALFYADHDIKLDQALELARSELEVRKDIYGYDALAWALYKNGRFAEAAEAIREAMKLGAQDASIYFHAGMIYNSLGEVGQARAHLEQALRLNPHFSILHEDVARRTLAGLKELSH
jgi:tetratricopeptide (TPR) repeat protein